MIMKKLNQQSEESVNPYFALRRNINATKLDSVGFWSYPVFVRNNDGNVYWMYLILPAAILPKKKITALFRPKAVLITKPKSKTIIHYDNFRFGHDPFPKDEWDVPKSYFPHQSIRNLTVGQFRNKEKSLLAKCDKETNTFKEEGELSLDFCNEWNLLINPIFISYLSHLAPEFCNNLKKEEVLKNQ